MTQSGVLLDAFSNSRTVLAFQIGGMKEFLPADAPTVSCFDTREYARSIVEFVNDPIAQARAGAQRVGVRACAIYTSLDGSRTSAHLRQGLSRHRSNRGRQCVVVCAD